MTARGGLHRRLVLAFAGFGAVLAVLFGGLLYAVFHDSEDAVQRRFLSAQLEHFLEHSADLPGGTVAVDRFVTIYRDVEELPPWLRGRVAPLAAGFHEVGEETFGEDSSGAFHVLVSRGPDGGDLTVVLDTTPFEAREEVSLGLMAALAIAVALVAVVGAGLGTTVATSIVRPVTRLAQRVRDGVPEGSAIDLDPAEYPAEVGTLALAFRDAFSRIRDFVDRERQFTANASHELRTPVTVIAGAAELISARPDATEPGLARPLQRIRRATAAMEETIEVFLLLAREDAVRTDGREIELRRVVEDVADNLGHLAEGRPVELIVDVERQARLVANERVLAIVLGNFVGNALQRTEQGSVTVAGDERAIMVTDTGQGIPAHLLDRVTGRGVRGTTGGHGLGLAIVSTVCERCGWRLELDSVEGRGTRIVLHFGP